MLKRVTNEQAGLVVQMSCVPYHEPQCMVSALVFTTEWVCRQNPYKYPHSEGCLQDNDLQVYLVTKTRGNLPQCINSSRPTSIFVTNKYPIVTDKV